ncbi:DUF3152 domain-containing protein [Actinosynnema sp. NPDC047251]|uniref:DUF3152 domain-containing protein n=1 Tax=Saccharothrix espanaensis (strain ATCC 51144 / DSM 44229 / JCM 9112 / NBRC 15066 / NRRL 15764) TaxID=1179773 RepID=K0K3K0_SACES|nr:DUF3152 domain-containing protein [Saccharothrix espanaensis]CCH32142.1 hypothetical protein BN6_48700 [Saccharothrix espanaensis DSM 44229]
MRAVPVVYVTGLCLATTAVLVLEFGTAPRPAAVRWPVSGVPAVSEPAPPAPTGHVADLPEGLPFPQRGAGTWHVVPGTFGSAGTAYSVEVEDGTVPPRDEDNFAAVVDYALAHPRGWARTGEVFHRVDGGTEPDLRVRLTSQETARRLCGFELPYDVSCRIGSEVHVSAARWFRGAHTYRGELRSYRLYVVNHEVGHFLGRGHEPCPADGGPAPVMMQQTLSTANDELAAITSGVDQGVTITADGKACTANPWPTG